MSTILALDTSSEACSVAICKDNHVIKECCELTPRQHTMKILPMIYQLLAESGIELNELQALAFGSGPGSFTGLRIASGVIQGLAYGLNIPVIAVSTLAALAHNILPGNTQSCYALCTIDARMDEIYWAWYGVEHGEVIQKSVEQVDQPSALIDLSERKRSKYIGVGSGWKYSTEIIHAIGIAPVFYYPDVVPLARDIALLAVIKYRNGEMNKAETAQPSYIRNNMSYKKTSM